ncbi:MAG: ATP-binding protein [Mariprofundus sp.]
MSQFNIAPLLPGLFAEVRGHLQAIEHAMPLLENGSLDADGLALLQRSAHSIKGSAQMLGQIEIGEVGALLENAIEHLLKHKNQPESEIYVFIHQLHDLLEQHMGNPEAMAPLDVLPWQDRFRELCQPVAQPAAAQKKRRKPTRKGSAVSTDILASIRNSIEQSMPEKKRVSTPVVAAEITAISFRPSDDSATPAPVVNLVTDDLLMVERSRYVHLSNELTVSAAARHSQVPADAPLRKLADAMQPLQKRVQAMASADAENRMRLLASLQRDLKRQARALQLIAVEHERHEQRQAVWLDNLRGQLFTLTLRPLTGLFAQFQSTAAQLSQRQGKKMQLLLTGDAVELDQQVIEAVSEPLMHLITQAFDAIEEPNERRALAKPAQGQITVSATQQDHMVVLDVIDDGRGMNPDALRDSAVASGLISEREATAMDYSEIMALLYLPGMAMSPLQTVMRKLTGSIHIDSEQGKGTRVRLRLPVAPAMHPVLPFTLAGHRFGMIREMVEQIYSLSEIDIQQGAGPFGGACIDYQQHQVPVIDLRNTDADAPSDARLLVLSYMNARLAVVVDQLFDPQQLLIREVDDYLAYYHPAGLMGCAIANDGSVLMIVEPDALKALWRNTNP